ncbi:cation efflux protein [Backusella circina FSU 941]|nr:cation efflux protein [Backusella circina FSU 941]
MPNERTPLVNDESRGSIVAYTTNCSNITSGERSTAKSTKRKLWFAVILATCFFITELIAGYFANSLALMSDAFHLLSDVASFIVALAAIFLAEKPPTNKHTFGFHRAEVIAALVSVLTIWVLTGFLVYEAIQRLRSPQEIDARLMCFTASIGVVVNIVLAYVLGGHHHGQPKDEVRHGAVEEGNSKITTETNINLRAAALHVLGDLLAAIGVLVSSIILIFKPEMTFVDPMCTFFFSILVLYTTYHLVKDSLAVLMEGVSGNLHPDNIKNSLKEIPGVVAVHDLHVWALSPGKYSLTVHIAINHKSDGDYNKVLSRAQHIVCGVYGIHHSTVQIESSKSDFTSHCRPELCAPRQLE